MNIVAIIVSYKNEEMTCNYTDKELSKCKEITNVIIVNNAATVNSNAKILTGIKDCEQYDGKSYYGSRVVLISNKENSGFARGNNIGAEFAIKFLNPSYILFTNDDIHINDTDIIHKMLGHFHQDETIGAIGPKVIMPNGVDQSPIIDQGLFNNYLRIPLSVLFRIPGKKKREAYIKSGGKSDELMNNGGYCTAVLGAFFMVDSNKFQKCGMFDERTFLYCEEFILGARLKQYGYNVYYMPQTSVLHYGAVSTSKSERNKVLRKIGEDSTVVYFHYYHHYPKIWVRMVYRLGYTLRDIISFIGNKKARNYETKI